MSDKDKNQSGNKSGNVDKGSTKRQSDSTTSKEWSKIDKKGQGAGDRPKR